MISVTVNEYEIFDKTLEIAKSEENQKERGKK